MRVVFTGGSVTSRASLEYWMFYYWTRASLATPTQTTNDTGPFMAKCYESNICKNLEIASLCKKLLLQSVVQNTARGDNSWSF